MIAGISHGASYVPSSNQSKRAEATSHPLDSSPKEATSDKDELKPGFSANQQTLSEEEKSQVAELKARDREVKAHEAAHKSAGGAFVRGGISLSYQRGPDGTNYAVGGEVSIDTSAVPNNPEATLRKAETIRAAALAPADPSSQDVSVAAQATQMAAQARAAILKENSGIDQKGSSDSALAAYASTIIEPKGSNFNTHA